MGSTLNTTLGIALNSMQATQTTISTISHNISNVHTEGFTRQQVMTSNVAIEGFGSGVIISDIRQITDRFLSERITTQISAVGYDASKSTFMDNLEVMFGTPGASTSLEKTIGSFFNQMSNLANAPDSTSLQLNTVKNAEFVAQSLNNLSNEITSAQTRADELINEDIISVNESIRKIHQLNNEIIALGVGTNGGENANDLVDERSRQINSIAKHLNINVIYDELNRANVSTETGRRLIDTSYVKLERSPAIAPSIFQDISTRPVNPDGSPGSVSFPILTDRMTDGGIKGLVDIRDTEMVNLLAEVNNLASTMIDGFNRIHSQGTSIPPQNTLTSGNGNELSGAGADITTELAINVGDSFDISIVDSATGAPVVTTLAAGGGAGSLSILASPTTLSDIAAAINANPDIGADVTASTIIDADGNEQLQITANNAAYGVVMKNNVGNVLGELGMNNFFTGTDASDIAVRDDIVTDPARIATARMRDSDGGVSSLDNRNIIELAQLNEKPMTFTAAGNLANQSKSFTEYYINISSNLAIRLQDTGKTQEFNEAILTDMETRMSSTSGVNIDEELSNLLIFQRSYQASARIITLVDELLETLVNIV
tara:strand:- start:88074 stop:89879 length:1806 start_codon:yes stop_codon:yes gene_type:complete